MVPPGANMQAADYRVIFGDVDVKGWQGSFRMRGGGLAKAMATAVDCLANAQEGQFHCRYVVKSTVHRRGS